MDCIFCKIIHGEIPASTILETNRSISFLDAFPLTRGHTLVIPKTHSEKIQDMSKDNAADLFELIYRTISKVDKISGSTLVAIHNGKESGQEVPHVHVHLIPRSETDSAGPVHSMFQQRPKLTEQETKDLVTELKKY